MYKNEKIENGLFSVTGADANGAYIIGGRSPTTSGQFHEIGVYAQYTF